MSLLSVTVKKARFVCEEAEQFNSYVTLKLQNVKSTTVTVKGANPCWEQDFLFETNDVNAGLLVEVWCKGFLWDRFLGYYYIPLSEVSYMNEVTTNQSTKQHPASPSAAGLQQQQQQQQQRDTNSNTQQPSDIADTEGSGQWVSLDSEVEMRGAEIIGTKMATGHSLLIDCRLELPFDPENTEAADLQRKLEMLNNMMDQEARAEQARRQILYNIGHSGYSEDSDYTSDLNYPVGGQGANSSASQFRTAANQLATPQRSLETSRENSYEKDDHQVPGTIGGRLAPSGYGSYGSAAHSPRYDEPYPEEGPPQRYSQTQQHTSESSEPLFYNSRPRHYKEYRRRKHTWDYEDSQDGWYSEGYDYYGTKVDETRIYSDTEYYPSTTTSSSRRTRGPHRRPSLERQMTLYDEHSHYTTDGYGSDRMGKMSATYPECETDIRYNEYYDTITGYMYQDERYGQDDEDRQWDSGGKWYSGTSTYYENKRNRKTLPQRPASSIGIHRPDYRPTVTRQRSYESEELDYSGHSRRRKALQPQQRPTSRQEGTGKKLPPTPTKPSSVAVSRKLASLPATPSRQLPKTRTPSSEESYYKSDYNEDYNYAYRSQDNLPQDTYTDNYYGEQTSYDQIYTSGKAGYPEISESNQLTGSTYAPQVDDQYPQSAYQESRAQDTYDQTYAHTPFKDSYQQQYPQQEIYQDAYQGTAYQDLPYQDGTAYQDSSYPIASQAKDQYATQQLNDEYKTTEEYKPTDPYASQTKVQYTSEANEQYTSQANQYDKSYDESYDKSYDRSIDTIIKDNQADGYDQNNVQYQQTYTGQYDDYGVTVPSSVYDQNNVTNQYNQYQQEQYDSQYNITTSTGYDKDYQDTYNQVPVTSQDNYQNAYGNQQQSQKQQPEHYDDYQVPYSKEEDVPQTYKGDYQDQYQGYQESYDESYQDSYQGSFEEQSASGAERRQSEVPELSVTTPRGQTKTNGYPSSESEYFYPAQDTQEVSSLGSTRRKKLGKRDTSPLIQQNTDSLESRDDELKDSFETAVSSVGSSQPRKGYSEYSTAGDSSPAAATLVDSPQSAAQATPSTMVNHMTNHVTNHVSTSVTVTATVHATVHASSMANGKRLSRTESYQEELIEDEEYPEIVPKEPQRKDSQLSHHSQQSQQSQQSQLSQHSTHSQKPKLQRGDSYASDHYPDESYSRKGSYAQSMRKDSFSSSTQEGFKPPLTRTDSYQKRELTRGTSYGQNFGAPQPISRAESYQRGYFKDEDSIDEADLGLSTTLNGEYKLREDSLERYERTDDGLIRTSREGSLVDQYKGTPPLSRTASPQGSMTKQESLEESVQMDTPPRSPPEPPSDNELLEMVGAAPVPTQLKERPEMTARQRWHWAYNQIIMQLNVSRKLLPTLSVPA